MLIAIIAAMDEEIAPLKKQLKNKVLEQLGPFECYKGTLFDNEIILLKSGIGKVNAAISTTLLLDHYQPDYVINTGSAGGFNLSLNVGDIVISEKVCHYDVDLTAFNYEQGQLPELPTYFLPDKELIATTTAHLDQLSNVPYCVGLIASGDRFVHQESDVTAIKEQHPEIMACEMEAAAVAQVCHHFTIPFVIIRAISDIPGKKNVVAFETFLSQAAENYTQLLLCMLKGQAR